MSDANYAIIAKTSVIDSTWSEQVDRWANRPLKSDNKDLSSFKSFKGRLYCALEFGHTLVREPYRGFKNTLIVAQNALQFIREFFQTLFKEEGYSWGGLKTRGKDLLSNVSALFARGLTYFLDLTKLAAGVLWAKAAINTQDAIDDDDDDDKDIKEDDDICNDNLDAI